MNIEDKSKEVLIKELLELEQEHNSLKTRLEKELAVKKEEESILKKLILSAEEFIQFNDESPDYNNLLQIILEISGAKYGALNIFDDDGLGFTTVAFAGTKENITKGLAIIGFDIHNKHWNHDPSRAERTKQHVITRFKKLYELTGDIIPKSIVYLLEQTFGIEETYIVKIVKEGKVLGDFTLVFKKGDKLINDSLVELYANMAGMFLDRLKLTNSLKSSEIKHSTMISSISDVIGIIDPDGIIKYKSPNSEKWFGWKPEDLIGTHSLLTVHPDDKERVHEELHAIFEKENSSKKVEYRYKCKDGDYKIIELSATNLIKDPIINGVLINYHDITERKKTEQDLRNSENNFHSIFDNNSGAIAIIEPDTTISMVNEEFCRRCGYAKEEITGTSWKRLIPPEDLERLIEFNNRRMINPMDAPDKYDFSFYHKSGEIRQVFGSFAMLSNKKMIASFVDITDRRQAEEKLKESLALMEAILESIHNGILVVNSQGNVLKTNTMFAEMWNIPGDLINKKDDKALLDYVCEQLTDSDEFINKVTELYETPDAVSYDLIHFKDGRIFDRISKPMNLGDVPNGRVWSFLNITDRKKVENELINALDKAEESNRLKSSFLANMSHEIRTPMNGILGFTELLKNPNLSIEDQQSFIDLIQISGARMLNTINNIIDISRIESGMVKIDISETNVNDQIEFIYKFFKKEAEIKGLSILFKTSLPPEEAIIITDKEKVYGILTNLIKNAIKFTYDGTIEFGYEKKGDYLEYFVKDTGVGIPQKLHQVIFERFRQGKESHDRNFEGSGLGLSISKSYVDMLGGEIWVESLDGIGSTFYFTIPYNYVSVDDGITGGNASEKNKEVQIKNLKILIVEDDETSKVLLSKIVGKLCKEILYATKGADAVMTCHNNPDIDLVLMDISLPEMDGYEATRQIRQFNKDVTIIAQTGYGFSSDRQKALEAGCTDYISKPINKTILYDLIEKHLKKPGRLDQTKN